MMSKNELCAAAREIYEGAELKDLVGDSVLDLALHFLYSSLSGGAKDTLVKLVEKGILEDGDIPSKTGLDELLAQGLAAKIITPHDGCNAATYVGRDVLEMRYILNHPPAPRMPVRRDPRIGEEAVDAHLQTFYDLPAPLAPEDTVKILRALGQISDAFTPVIGSGFSTHTDELVLQMHFKLMSVFHTHTLEQDTDGVWSAGYLPAGELTVGPLGTGNTPQEAIRSAFVVYLDRL